MERPLAPSRPVRVMSPQVQAVLDGVRPIAPAVAIAKPRRAKALAPCCAVTCAMPGRRAMLRTPS